MAMEDVFIFRLVGFVLFLVICFEGSKIVGEKKKREEMDDDTNTLLNRK